MGDSQRQTTRHGHETEEELSELRTRLEQARAGERRAQALLESVASLMSLPDPVAVMQGIAENAVRHLDMSRVRVYRVDYDAGVLIEAACVQVDGRSGEISLPGMAQVRDLDTSDEPIELRPGNQLAEFAVGDRAAAVLDPEQSDDRGGTRVLVQMRTGHRSGSDGQGALVGVIDAFCLDRPTQRKLGLLQSLASMGAAAAEAARVEEFRSQLVSSVSHELRTPLAGIRAYNELLLDGDAGEINDEQRLFLERIESTCLHLDRMVDDLLDLSRLRAGEMIIRRAPVDVVEVIEHIIDTLSPEADRHDVTLGDEIVGELPMISSDSDRLSQVLLNLVGNALKYVDEGGTVLVRAELREGDFGARLEDNDEERRPNDASGGGRCLAIEVIDDGPGIAPDELDRVFDEFYRGRLTERATKGSGLGLSIASRLTRLLGGVLEVDSTPGEGSTFRLIFPVEATKEDEAE